ncbi:hypothetical protein HY989_04405 [Candidatus Micrarchaeota archaeon]|nr:hypothetical protein [Candidatus Micrarchaeota archaeon]
MDQKVSMEIYEKGEFLPKLTKAHFRKLSTLLLFPENNQNSQKLLFERLKNSFRSSVFAGFANISEERRFGEQISKEPTGPGKRRLNLYGNPSYAIIGKMLDLKINPKLELIFKLKNYPTKNFEIRNNGVWEPTSQKITEIDGRINSDLNRRVEKFLNHAREEIGKIGLKEEQSKTKRKESAANVFLAHMALANKYGRNLRTSYPEVAKALSDQINSEIKPTSEEK